MDEKILKEALEATFQQRYSSDEYEDQPEHEFSPKFERKMNKAIEKQKKQSKAAPKFVPTAVRKVACILAVVAVFTITTMSSSAFREQFKNFFVNIFHGHSEIKLNTDVSIDDIEKISIESIEANIPEGFELTNCMDKSAAKIREYFRGQEFVLIHISCNDSVISVDNENYDYEIYSDKKGNDYMVDESKENEQIVIVWSSDSVIYKITSNLSKKEIFEILK